MKFSVKHTFRASRSEVMAARERRFENPERFPDVKETEELERRREGNTLHTTRKISLRSKIPAILRGRVTEKMLDCHEHSEMDLNAFRNKWQVVAPHFKDVFSFFGETDYIEKEADGKIVTVRNLKGVCEVKVPIIGPAVEDFLVRQYKKTLQRDNEGIEASLEEMRGDGAGPE